MITLASKIPVDVVGSFDFSTVYNDTDHTDYLRISIIGAKKYILKKYPLIQEAGIKHFKRICLISKITERFLLIGIIWVLYKSSIFHWILNILLHTFDRLILGKLAAVIFFKEDYLLSA